jgi:hypothetical protein
MIRTVKLFRNKKSLILISTLLIVCFLIVGCGNKTSVPKTSSQPEKQEIQKQEETKDHIQEDQIQADSKKTTDTVLNMDDSNTELTHPKTRMDSTNIQKRLNPSLNEVSFKKNAAADSDVSDVSNKGHVQEKSHNTEPITSVTISIVGPKDTDVIMEPTEVEIAKEETVLDVLKKVTRQNNIPMSFRGKKSTAYVEGINNLFEFDHGAKSGWLYKVNGSFYSKSAGEFTLKANDVIEWLYTLDMGRDVEADISDLGGVSDE